jgi:hypothetical protein
MGQGRQRHQDKRQHVAYLTPRAAEHVIGTPVPATDLSERFRKRQAETQGRSHMTQSKDMNTTTGALRIEMTTSGANKKV